MPTAEKVAKVNELTQKMAGSTAIFLADFTGLDVASVTDLRSQLRKASVEYEVVKNRLAKRAAQEAGIAGLEQYFVGPTAIAFAKDDPVAPAKILQKFIDTGGKIAIKSGLVDGQVISSEQIKALASLPSREQLLAQVVRAAQGPLYGLSGVLTGLLRNLVGVIAAIEKKQGEGA
ncbi:MAG: 50S ribosomal protein L10 [Candidatus Latescibacteria bacterium]|nr:50S ribosomal protein L10 [Candidatus Latescibacterota bacterium]